MKKYMNILVCVLSVLLTACNFADNEKSLLDKEYESGIVKDYILSFADDYSINEREDKIEVVLQAPDFSLVINTLNEQNSDLKTADDVKSLSEEEKEKRLMEALKSSDSSKMKEYVLVVDNTDENTIKDAFWNKITYDMMMSELRNIKLDDNWEIEE